MHPPRLIKGLGVAQIASRIRRLARMIQPRYFVKHLNIYAFIWLHERQFVLRQVLPDSLKRFSFGRLAGKPMTSEHLWLADACRCADRMARPPNASYRCRRAGDESFGVAAYSRPLLPDSPAPFDPAQKPAVY